MPQARRRQWELRDYNAWRVVFTVFLRLNTFTKEILPTVSQAEVWSGAGAEFAFKYSFQFWPPNFQVQYISLRGNRAAVLIEILFQNSVLICCLSRCTFCSFSVSAVTIQIVKGDVRTISEAVMEECQVPGLVYRELESKSSSDPKNETEFLRPLRYFM